MISAARYLLLLSAIALPSGCSVPAVGRGVPEGAAPDFTHGVSIPALPMKITGGSLLWHRRLPDETYTLEMMAIEVLNFGELDIAVAQVELVVDGKTELFDTGVLVEAGAAESLAVQPMMNGYDGGSHFVYVALLNEDGRVLSHSGGEVVGPLSPEPD